MRKVISVLLAVIMVIGVLPAHSYGVETESHEKIFSDMPYNWSTAALENAVKNGLLTGADGKIMPKDSLTRAQMATIIVRAFGAADKGNLKGFSEPSYII